MKNNKVLRGLLFSAALLGFGLVSTNSASADQVDGTWAPRTVEEIKAGISGDIYTIQWGDYLSGISEATGITVDDLANWNNIANKDLIYAGNQLSINGAVVTDSTGNSYTLSGTSVAGVQAKSAERATQAAVQQAQSQVPGATTGSTSNTGSTSSTGTSINNSGSTTNTGGSSNGGSTNTGNTGNTDTGNSGDGAVTPVTPTDPTTPVTPTDPETPVVSQAVTINYVTTDGTVLLEPTTITGNVGEQYSVNYTHIEGYEIADGVQSHVVTISGQAQSFNFVYKASSVTPVDPTDPTDPTDPEVAQPVTVNYLSTDGTVLAPSTTLTGNIGDQVYASYVNIEGYEIADGVYAQTAIVSGQAQSLNFIYKSKTVDPVDPGDGRVVVSAPAELQDYATAHGLVLGTFYEGEDNGDLGQYLRTQGDEMAATAQYLLLTPGSPFFDEYTGWRSASNFGQDYALVTFY